MTIKSIEISQNPVTAWETYHRSLYPKDIGQSAEFFGLDRGRVADWSFGRLRFNMAGSRPELEEFFEYALGRDVKVHNDRNGVDYEGFILSLDLNTGVHKLKKSLHHIFNRAWARYDATGGVDQTQRSTVLNDTSSQDRFGIIERIVGGGQQSGLVAIDQGVKNKLEWFTWPKVNPDFGAGSGDPNIQIVAVGYGHTLKWRVYNQTVLVGDANLSVVASAVITACGDFIASSDIDLNLLQVPQEYDTDRIAYDVMDGLSAMGDLSGNRWLNRLEVGRAHKMGPTARTI